MDQEQRITSSDPLKIAADDSMRQSCVDLSQSDVRRGKSTQHALDLFASKMKDIFANGIRGKSRYALFVDFTKAFDNVCRETLIEKLHNRFSISGNMLNLLAAFLDNNEFCIRNINAPEPPRVTQNIGVQQGDSLSPLLFIMYMDDLLLFLKNNFADKQVDILMYADDLCVITDDRKEMKSVLQHIRASSEVTGQRPFFLIELHSEQRDDFGIRGTINGDCWY